MNRLRKVTVLASTALLWLVFIAYRTGLIYGPPSNTMGGTKTVAMQSPVLPSKPSTPAAPAPEPLNEDP